MGNRRPLPRLLPQKLVIIREHLHLTQTAIKDSLGLSTSARISEYENGKRKPRLIVALGYSYLAKVPMSSLVEDEISLTAFRKQLNSFDYKKLLGNTRMQPIDPVSHRHIKAPIYTVHAPLTPGRHYQQIRATIQGTPEVAGSVDISPSGRRKAYISNLHVDQRHRRRGVAGRLIDAVITTARRQGFKEARLEARPFGNSIPLHALVALYRRQGFRRIGKNRRGSLLMERSL
jgi:GNAT superfamily N-acetyltransferase/DNA-binding XRE family transcriptional regulator